MTPSEDERLDVDETIARLQAALRLQYRSALGYTAAAGCVVGFAYAHLADALWGFAERDLDFDDPGSPTVASEFVTPAVTTGGDGTPHGPYYGPFVPFNPHIRFFDGDRRGSLVAELTRRQLEVQWRVARRVAAREEPVWPLRRFTVESGRPGVHV